MSEVSGVVTHIGKSGEKHVLCAKNLDIIVIRQTGVTFEVPTGWMEKRQAGRGRVCGRKLFGQPIVVRGPGTFEVQCLLVRRPGVLTHTIVMGCSDCPFVDFIDCADDGVIYCWDVCPLCGSTLATSHMGDSNAGNTWGKVMPEFVEWAPF